MGSGAGEATAAATAPANGAVVRLDAVRKSFGDNLVLDGIDLTVATGEVLVVIGPSGSGKSTLLRCVNLLEPLDSGRIFFEGDEITRKGTDVSRVRQRIGMVFQQFNLFPHLTVLNNVTIAARRIRKLTRAQADKRAHELLAQVGLANKAYQHPHQLCGGQQQRVALARAPTFGSAKPVGTTHTTHAQKTALPPLPDAVKSRNRWIIGVKCDVPPFGYIDVQGKNQGFDVEIGRWFARYAFGRSQRVTFVCAPTASREPLITSGRVDLVISTFTYTADPATRIDFSEPYYNATGRLLVKNSGAVQKLADIKGHNVATTSGSVYDRWVKNGFPTASVITAATFTNAKLAFDQGRADCVRSDDAGPL